MQLTDKVKAACQEYLVDFNMLQAMVRAGYSANHAHKNGYLLLKDPDVAFYLKGLMDKQQERKALSADMVLEELRRLAISNIADYYKWSEDKCKYVLKALDELTREQTAAIAKYTPGEGYTLYNKDASLDKLAKYFKLYSEIEATVTNFVMMPEVKIGGKAVQFNIGKPAPKKGDQKKS